MFKTFKTSILSISILCSLIFVPLAWGHAVPQKLDPSKDATVPAPAVVSIIFDDELEAPFSKLWIEDKHKQKVGIDGVIDPKNPKRLVLQLSSSTPLPVGIYHVYWVAVARDGHRTHGDYKFTVK